MSKIMNRPEDFTDESLAGIVLAHPDMLRFADDKRAVVRADGPKEGKVAIVTGGGYGHLPLFLGYVGKGLCDGVAVGNVFTSPSAETITEAVKGCYGNAGVLFLYGNYMGDTMNFDMAAEMLEFDDIHCETVKGSDDIASAPRSNYTDRRGIAGIFFAYKIAGAKAERMASLEEVKAIAEKVGENVATLGFAMAPCQLPGAPKPHFELPGDEMELGMGIHGEPGVERTKMKTSEELAEVLCDRLSEDLSLQSGEEIAVLVNSLGATSKEELYILYNDLYKKIEAKGLKVGRVYLGEFAISMEMQGASVSFLRLNDEFKELLDDEAKTPFIRLG